MEGLSVCTVGGGGDGPSCLSLQSVFVCVCQLSMFKVTTNKHSSILPTNRQLILIIVLQFMWESSCGDDPDCVQELRDVFFLLYVIDT